MSKIRALLVVPDYRPLEVSFEAQLESYQALVGGHIEALGLNDSIDLIVNENGKFDGSTPNRLLHYSDFDYLDTSTDKPFDLIHGTFLVIGADNEKGEWRSLSDDEVTKYSERFHDIEIFLGHELGMVR